MSYRILVLEGLTERGQEILRAEGWTLDQMKAQPQEELLKLVPPYHAILVRSGSKMTAEVIDAAKNLKVIGRAGVGVDNIDLAAATRRGVLVMNSPGGNTISTAELAIALMLALARNIPPADSSMKGENWDRKTYAGVELYGKRLGVVGLGRIGREVASRARAFGMEVQAYDPFVSAAVAEEVHVKLRSLEEILQTSDYLTLHTTLTDETHHLLNKETLSKVKPGVRIVNAARGPLIDPDALIDALDSGRVAGAGLDVHAKEPPQDWRLAHHPKVIATPAPRGVHEGGPAAGGNGHRPAGPGLPQGRDHPAGGQLLLAGRGPVRQGAPGHGPRASASASSSGRPAGARWSGSSSGSTATFGSWTSSRSSRPRWAGS